MLLDDGHAALADFKAILLSLLITFPIGLFFQFLGLPFGIEEQRSDGILGLGSAIRVPQRRRGLAQLIGPVRPGAPLLL